MEDIPPNSLTAPPVDGAGSVFQSSLYFGSPESPSDNPFSFAAVTSTAGVGAAPEPLVSVPGTSDTHTSQTDTHTSQIHTGTGTSTEYTVQEPPAAVHPPTIIPASTIPASSVPVPLVGVAHPPLAQPSIPDSVNPQYSHQSSNEIALAPPLSINNEFVGVAHPPLAPPILPDSVNPQYSHQSSNEIALAPPLSINNEFVGVVETNAHLTGRRLTNADLADSLPVPNEVDPVNYQSNEPVSTEPVSPLDEEREITEGDSNPPSAAPSLSSLLPLDTGDAQRSALMDSPVQLVPPLSLEEEVPMSTATAGGNVHVHVQPEEQTLCHQPPVTVPKGPMDITPPDGEPTTTAPPLSLAPPTPITSVPPTVSLAFSSIAPPTSISAPPSNLRLSDNPSDPPLSAFSPPNDKQTTPTSTLPQATPTLEHKVQEVPPDRPGEVPPRSNEEERGSSRLSPRQDYEGHSQSMYDRRYDHYDHTHYYDRYNTSYYDDRDYYYRNQQHRYGDRDHRNQYRVRNDWNEYDRARRPDPRYHWNQRYDRYHDYYDPRYDWRDQERYRSRDDRYDMRYQRERHYDQQHQYYYQDGRGYADQTYYDEQGYPLSSGYSQDTSVIYSQDNSYYDGEAAPYESTHIEAPPTDSYGGPYPPYIDDRYPVGGAYDQQYEVPPAAGSPSPPRRDTPLCFCFPHVSVRFSIGGQLVTGSPVKPSEHVPAIVHIHSLQSLVPEFNNFAESLEDYPGPLLISDTPKSAVVKFCTSRASAETDPDHALLWKYLSLLCQQNGVVLPTDISDLLTQQENEDNLSKSPRGVGVGGAIEEKGCGLDEFRTLLLAGRKKDALNLACSRGLWGHALMLSSRMDDQSRTYVVNRFTASLLTSDPLSTFYTLMLGRLPSVSKPEGLSRSGDWQSHLAMMITNLNPTQDTSCISNLGDSLLARGRVAGAHFCYHLCNIPFGSYGDTETSKYSLLGIDHTNIMRGCYPSPEDLVRTEVLEFALGLSKAEFVLPNFQTFKLLHLFKLIEAGLTKKALSYCESISWFVIRSPSSFNNTFLQLLTDFSVRLHYASYPSGVMENELPPWILTLDQSVGDNSFMGGVSPANVISRASPSLSSAAGLAAAASHQPLLPSSYTTQEYLQVPGGGAGGGASVQYPVPEGYSTTVEPVTEVTTGDAGDTGQYTGYTAPVGYAVASEDTTDYTGYVPPSNVQATGYVPPSNVQATGYVPPSSVQATGYVPPSIADSIAQSTVANTGEQLPVPAVTATDATGFQGITEPPANPNPMVYSTAEQETLPDQYGSLMNYQQPWAQSWDTGTSTIPESQSAGMHGGESLESSSGLMSSSSQVDVVRSIHGFNGYNSSSTLMGDSSTVFTAPPTDNKPHLPSEGNKEKSNENEEDVPNNTKDVDKDKVAADSKSWLGRLNPFNLIPKGPKQGYLPDDKNPRIIFDKEKNRWIDLDADDQNDSGPAPPPTDSELKSTTGISSTSGGVGRPGGGARGRLAKARYVDVARSNKTQSTAPPPPALAPPPGGLMPLAQGMQFNLFVPAQPNQQNDGVSNFETLYNPVPVPSTSDTPPTATNESLSNTVTPSEVTPSSSSHTIQPQEHLGPSMAVSRFPPSQNPHHIPQDQSSLSVYQTPAAPATGHQPHLPPAPPPQSRTERRTASESSDVSIGVPEAQDKMEPPKPQFFNPNDFTNMRRTAATAPHQRSDPFPDNVSDASVLSEFSQEVSQINKQAMSRQRLRPGSRPRYQYPPSSWQQGQPRPTQAPPPGPQGNWL